MWFPTNSDMGNPFQVSKMKKRRYFIAFLQSEKWQFVPIYWYRTIKGYMVSLSFFESNELFIARPSLRSSSYSRLAAKVAARTATPTI